MDPMKDVEEAPAQEWVMGKRGRPIRVGGRAHKALLKLQPAVVAPAPTPTAIGGVSAPVEPCLFDTPETVQGPTKKRKKALNVRKPLNRRKPKLILHPLADEEKTYDAPTQGSGDMLDDDNPLSEEDEDEGEVNESAGIDYIDDPYSAEEQEDSAEEQEDDDPSELDVKATHDELMSKHGGELTRAYEAVGDGPAFQKILKKLMEGL